jgi:hypothetical protein
MDIYRIDGSTLWHSDMECTALRMELEYPGNPIDHTVMGDTAFHTVMGDMAFEDVVGEACRCATMARYAEEHPAFDVAAAYFARELATLAAGTPDWELLAHMIPGREAAGYTSSIDEMVAVENVRQAWRAAEGNVALRRRLAPIIARPSELSDREAFCDTMVTLGSLRKLSARWADQGYLADQVAEFWSKSMCEYSDDDALRRAAMAVYANRTEATAVTSVVCDELAALLDRLVDRCVVRDRVVVPLNLASILSDQYSGTKPWELLGRYLVGFVNGLAVLVLPEFEIKTSKSLWYSSSIRSEMEVNRALDFGALRGEFAIDFDAKSDELSRSLSRLFGMIEVSHTLWRENYDPTRPDLDVFTGRPLKGGTEQMKPRESSALLCCLK